MLRHWKHSGSTRGKKTGVADAQRRQFTSFAWTDRMRRSNVRISMDGKGRFLDNIFPDGDCTKHLTAVIERLWRSMKYECVYLHAWESGSGAKAGI